MGRLHFFIWYSLIVAILLLISFLCISTAYSAASKTPAQSLPKAEIEQGIRPTPCTLPSPTYGRAKRVDKLCVFIGTQEAMCPYAFVFIDPAGSVWICHMLAIQPACDAAWLPMELRCIALKPNVEALIPKDAI